MFDFNDPKYKDPSSGNFTWQGSVYAGQDQASRGYSLTPQMQNETWASYETRHNAYHDYQKNNQ
ncbi:hypothetical protein [Desulforegula conservatrix]|uniref:hypothetical protein n=1 Tax=Desulforegula conservatrix TaxID=153026 RepID=UPI00042393DD|nr:hypothetical protein [Desulforegula conservatrix]